MARVRNAPSDADALLRESILLYLRFMQETFPTDSRAEKIAKLERGEVVRIAAIDLWKAAFNAGLECEADLRDAAHEGWIFKVSKDGVRFEKIHEDEFIYRPNGRKNQQRDAANRRWLRR